MLTNNPNPPKFSGGLLKDSWQSPVVVGGNGWNSTPSSTQSYTSVTFEPTSSDTKATDYKLDDSWFTKPTKTTTTVSSGGSSGNNGNTYSQLDSAIAATNSYQQKKQGNNPWSAENSEFDMGGISRLMGMVNQARSFGGA
jgi:hypothetical protein